MCNTSLGNSNSITPSHIRSSHPNQCGRRTGSRPSNFLTSLCGCVITVAANLSWRYFYLEFHSSPKAVYTLLVEKNPVSRQAAELRSLRVAINVLQGAERQILLKGPCHHQLSPWFPLSIFLRRGRSPSTCALVCPLRWDHSVGYFCKLSNDQTEKIVFLRLPLEAGHDSRAQYPSIFAFPGRVVGCSVCPVHPMGRAAGLGLAGSPWYEPP